MGKLVDAARTYIGVKFRHRGRSRHGVDCAGLGVLAYRDCGVQIADWVLYGREPYRDGLVENLTKALGDPLPAGEPMHDGDVIVFRFNVEPHHVGIVAEVQYDGVDALNVIHADGHTGRVLEQRLTPDMVDRITHHYRKEVT